MRRFVLFWILAGCAAQTSTGSKETNVIATTSEVGEEGTDVELTSGSGVSVPPGALAIGSDVTVAEVDTPSDFTVATAASQSVEVFAKDKDGNVIETVDTPMTVNIALEDELGLNLLQVEATDDNLCVLLKTRSSNLFVWRRSAISLAGRIASIQTLNLGTFQLVYCGEEVLDGFTDASAAGATGEEPSTFSFTIPGGTHDFGHENVCVFVLKIDSDHDDDEDQEKDCDKEDCGDDFAATILAGSSAAATKDDNQTFELAIAPSQIEDNKEYLLGTLFNNADCPFEQGVAVDLDKAHDFQGFLGYVIDASLLLGGSSSLGSAEFPLGKTTLRIGAPTGTGTFNSFDTNLCIEADGDGHIGMVSAGITSDSKIDGFEEYTLITPGNDGDLELRATVGTPCRSFSDRVETDPVKGMPYRLEIGKFSESTVTYLTPVKMNLETSVFALLYGGRNACLDMRSTDGHDLGETVINLETPSFDLLFPYVANSSGEARYDLNIGVLNEGGKSCDNNVEQDYPSNDRLLTTEIDVPDL